MKARILYAYHEVTGVEITYSEYPDHKTRIDFTGDFHYFRAHEYTKWVNGEN